VNPRWMEQANCATTDPHIFHVGKGESSRPAKRVCRECRVIDECLSWALGVPGISGVLGGMTEQERRKYRRQQERLARAEVT
jgi:WhiB family transcriptional regulator, redox-sensing transcriptional regulator